MVIQRREHELEHKLHLNSLDGAGTEKNND